MDEATALGQIEDLVDAAGDDAAIVGGLAITTDMLHERTDFPEGTTKYTAGWRAVGASLSDLAAMGASATAAVAVYAVPSFVQAELEAFIGGATDVCESVGGSYVGGDLDTHREFTVATTAVGCVDEPVYRSGARSGDGVYVSGSLGRSAAALELFRGGAVERANELFRFNPRVPIGRQFTPVASAMIDSSDGLARSLHQLANASDCGFAVDRATIPVDPIVHEVASSEEAIEEYGLFFGEDFELVFTAPEEHALDGERVDGVPITRIGTATEASVTIDGEPLPDRGYTHGGG